MEKYLLSLILLLPINYLSAKEIRLYTWEEMQEIKREREKDPKFKYINEACKKELEMITKNLNSTLSIQKEIKQLEEKIQKLKNKKKIQHKATKETGKKVDKCSRFHEQKYNEKLKTSALRLLNQ